MRFCLESILVMYYKHLKLIHKPLLAVMKSTRDFDLQIIDGNNLPDYSPVIYVVNHTNSHDIPVASEVIKKHHNVLLGKQPLKIIDRIAFCLNGVIWVDRKNRLSKHNAKSEIIKCLNNKTNILMFPEGTWNRSDNKIMLPLYWGCVDIAKSCNVPICPIILDYTPKVCYAKVGKPIVINETESKQTAINHIRDEMATLRWELWEKQPILKRDELSNDYYKKILQHDADEYPKINLEYESSVVRKEHLEYCEIFAHLNQIVPNFKTAFLFRR